MKVILEPEVVTKYCEFFKWVSTCDISDALTRLNLDAVRMRGILPLVQFAEGAPHMAGPAKTIRYLPCHYKMQYQDVEYKLTEVVQNTPAGSVLVVEGGEFHKPAQGEMNGLTAVRAGVAGSVGDGAVRDVDAVRKLPLPVFYKPYPIGITMESYVGRSIFAGVDIPIHMAGAMVRAGDIIVGDNNGVVVVPVEWVENIAEICKEIQALESDIRNRASWDDWKSIYASSHKGKYAGDNDTRPDVFKNRAK